MKVLVLGGTGSIGAAVVKALLQRRHEVLGLARSGPTADRLRSDGAQPVPGDIRSPDKWADVVDSADAVIQVAGDFTGNAESLGRNLISLLPNRFEARKRDQLPTYIYTGGCWLYGSTGDRVATEDSPCDAPAEWAWSVDHLK